MTPGVKKTCLRRHMKKSTVRTIYWGSHSSSWLIWRCRGVGFLEHPEEPHWVPQAPSIWRTVLMKRLLEIPVFNSHSFDQGEHGASANAPTTLLLLRMPQAKHALNNTPGNGRAPVGKFKFLGGRNADNSWKTAVKKLYPSAFCQVLVTIMIDSVTLATEDVASLPQGCGFKELFHPSLRRLLPRTL